MRRAPGNGPTVHTLLTFDGKAVSPKTCWMEIRSRRQLTCLLPEAPNPFRRFKSLQYLRPLFAYSNGWMVRRSTPWTSKAVKSPKSRKNDVTAAQFLPPVGARPWGRRRHRAGFLI